MATNGFSLGTAWIEISPSMRGMNRAIERELGGVNGSGVGRQIGSQLGSGITGSLANFAIGGAIAGAVSSLTSSITASMSALASEAITASDATIKFAGTLSFAEIDTAQIDALTESTRAYADATVYELGDIQNVTAQLASNGVNDFAKLAEAAGNLNAVAGGNAETFKSVGMVMTQTAGQGKLTTENWNQLSDAIPGASGKIQEALLAAGAFTGNFRDEMTKGEITAEEFNAAVMQLGSQPVAVEAATSVQTFEGMLGNLQATIVGGLSDAFAEARPAIGSVFEIIGNAASVVLPMFADALGTATTIGGQLWSIFADGDFTGLAGFEEDSPLVGFLFTLRDLGPGVIDVMGSLWNAIVAFGQYVAGVALSLAPFASVLVDIGGGLLPVLAGAFQFVADNMSVIGPIILGVVAAFVGFRVVTGIMAGYQAVMGLVTMATGAYAAATYGAAGASYAATAATTAQRVAVVAGAAAQKIATAAQWAWNAAMSANPIMLVVIAIAALVAGLVWFFTQTELGRTIWEGFVNAIATAWNWLWTSVLQPVFTAIGAIFTWLYENVISPIVAGVVLYVQAWAAIFTWLWVNILSPTFTLIGAIFTWLWDVVISVIIITIQAAIYGLGLVFQWLYVNIIQPTFTAIGAIFTWLYTYIITPIITGVILYIQLWGAIFSWLWTSIISPTFTAIGAIFTWLYVDIIQPVWSGIQAAIQVVADWLANTLWPNIQTVLGYMGAGFQILKDTISTVWNNIMEAAKAPVRFIIETVYRDGIKYTFDTIAEAVGISERLPDVYLPQGFASGGVLPGYTPGRDVYDFISPNGGGHLRLSGGEAIMRPEFARAVGGVGGVNMLNALARRGRLGDVFGGSRAFADGGIWDAVGATFSGAGDWLANVASKVAQIVGDPIGAITKLIKEPAEALLASMGGGRFGDMFAGMPITLIDKVGEWFATLIKPTTTGATGNWQGGQTLARVLPYVQATGTIITDTYRDPAYNAAVGGSRTSYHMDAANPAVDVAGSESAMWAFYNLLIADPGGWRQILWQVAGHYDHVHVANQGGVYGQLPVFDQGGWMQPGLAVNKTTKPEAVFTGEQWAVLEKNLGNGPRELVIVDQDGDLVGRMRVEAADVAVKALGGVGL